MKKHIVVLTGAGSSAESGLKTFRDADGLWEGFNVEDVATPGAWKKDPQLVLNFYNMRRADVAKAKPNAAHIGLAELETDFEITIITQNIDDLHERAGSTHIVHLHGEIFKMRSEKISSLIYEIREDILHGQLAEDGAQLRPHIVWFEEEVPMINVAAQIAKEADIFIVIGTSLAVYPAAGLVHYAPRSAPKYIIDKNIPDVSYIPNLIKLEKPATERIKELKKLLNMM